MKLDGMFNFTATVKYPDDPIKTYTSAVEFANMLGTGFWLEWPEPKDRELITGCVEPVVLVDRFYRKKLAQKEASNGQ